MKTTLNIAAIFVSFFTFQINAQDRTTISAANSEISDNLDLTAVSSIFGESENLSDFERRLNDPKLQISNLDLNNDNRVDYLRVIESVENSTHVVVIQSVLGRDLYQDVATIEIQKNPQNKISIQIVGNAYIYGQNYIYEPVYYNTPRIYASFWVNFYKPYYSSWTWNYYPTYYYAWNPYPVYRYRQNVYGCVNYSNRYNYVSYRSCYRAPIIYNSYSCNSYERQYPQYAFSRRNSNASNRYELDQRRYSYNNSHRSESYYGNNNSNYSRNYSNYNNNATRGYNQDISYNQRVAYSTREESSPNRISPSRLENQSDYYQNRNSTRREINSQRDQSQSDYSQNRTNYPREISTERDQPQRDYNQNRTSSPREINTQREQPQRDSYQNRGSSSRENNPQRNDYQRNNNYTSRENNRRI